VNFSQRYFKTEVQVSLQIDSMSLSLKTRIWNTFVEHTQYKNRKWGYNKNDFNYTLYDLTVALFGQFFVKTLSNNQDFFLYSNFNQRYTEIIQYFNQLSWNQIYDFIEFVIQHCPENLKHNYIDACNKALSIEQSGYRIINCRITPITDKMEIESIETAINKTDQFIGVKAHLKQALDHFSDREAPDYRNVIKESISAVESMVKQMVDAPNATLGKALIKLENKYKIAPTLGAAFSKLYGYSSNDDGIRHCLLEESNVTQADALFMLITCSAFINYLKVKYEQ
jgi:hypothetical protein